MGDKKKSIENKIEQQKFLERLGKFCTDVLQEAYSDQSQYIFSVDENDTVGEPSQLMLKIIFPQLLDAYPSQNAYYASAIKALFNSLNFKPKQIVGQCFVDNNFENYTEQVYDFNDIYKSPELLDILNNYDNEGLKNKEIQTFISNYKKINDSISFFNSNVIHGKSILKDRNYDDNYFVWLDPGSTNYISLFSPEGFSSSLIHFCNRVKTNILRSFLEEQGVDLSTIKNVADDGFDLPFSELSKLIPKFDLAPPSPAPKVLYGYKGDVKNRAESDKGDNKIQADAGEAPVNTDQRSEDKPRDNKPTGSI